ncbi:hypothetical protein EVAR_14443_1 [Eumeta japonica]|uniref:Uncharacterized protein n=1 Tax=Eumeta variegata TaxID=151549 RepID=A0A4C1TX85_EUMVA|nr:hypothetical protein EVAR_14443_1 [Eumeta japonica]
MGYGRCPQRYRVPGEIKSEDKRTAGGARGYYMNLGNRDGVVCMNELKVRLHNLNSPSHAKQGRREGKWGSGTNTLSGAGEGCWRSGARAAGRGPEGEGAQGEIFTSREFGSVFGRAEQNLNGLWNDWTTRFTCGYFRGFRTHFFFLPKRPPFIS